MAELPSLADVLAVSFHDDPVTRSISLPGRRGPHDAAVLRSSEGSRDFYLGRGFDVIGELPLSTGARFWQMRRLPR
jgi:hypothetical protein